MDNKNLDTYQRARKAAFDAAMDAWDAEVQAMAETNPLKRAARRLRTKLAWIHCQARYAALSMFDRK